MDDTRFTSALDTDTEAALRPVRRVEVLTEMAGRWRIWTLEEKLASVAEMERRGNIAALSRERGVSMSLLYTWRRELRYAAQASQLPPCQEPMFVPVMAQVSSPAPGEGGDNWAVIATLIENCKLSSINPHTWLTETLTKLANGHHANRIGELIPWANVGR